MSQERINATEFVQVLSQVQQSVEQAKAYLSQLDSHIGDGDHGFGIANGFRVGYESVVATADITIDQALSSMGMSLIKVVGGTSGTIFGSWFQGMAKAAKGHGDVGLPEFCAMFEMGLELVSQRGHAQPGDKTMVDALNPALLSLKDSVAHGVPLADALRLAGVAAVGGAESTKEMVGRHGRARYFREKSIGYQDAGATTVSVIVQAMADAVTQIAATSGDA